ncbi:MAG: hypothetical protein C0490_08845 [Marivirga sp.]|nr:hypothetical protein [Marivirga sp.]
MKSFGIIHFFLLIILLLAFECSHAQDYLITSKGDSLTGQIKPLFYGVDKKVQITTADKKKNVYPMFQIKVFRYKNELYQPVKGPEGYTFMKLVKPGYLTLYNYQLANQITFDGTYLLKKDGEGIDLPNLTFKKAMKKFLEDCETVAAKIDDGTLGKKELNQIIDEYNQCIDNRTINHDKILAEKAAQTKIISAWDVLEEKVKAQPDFEGKNNALEMIQEIKGKIAKSEKIPNFLLDGLKSSLQQDAFKTDLENALKEIN